MTGQKAEATVHLEWDSEMDEWSIEKIDMPRGYPLTAEDPDGERYNRVNEAAEKVAYALDAWNDD